MNYKDKYLGESHVAGKNINIEYVYLEEKDKAKLYMSVKNVIGPKLFNILKEGREGKNFIKQVSNLESHIKNTYTIDNLNDFIEHYCEMLDAKINIQKGFALILQDIKNGNYAKYDVNTLYKSLKESTNNEIEFFAYSGLLKYFCEIIMNYLAKTNRSTPENMVSTPQSKSFYLEFNENLKNFFDGKTTKNDIVKDFFNNENSFFDAFLSDNEITNGLDLDIDNSSRDYAYTDKYIDYINQLLTIDNVLEKYVQFKKVFLHDLMLYYYIINGNMSNLQDDSLEAALEEIFKLDKQNDIYMETNKDLGLLTLNELLGSITDESYGTKGVNLSILKNSNINVPKGFAFSNKLLTSIIDGSITDEEKIKIILYLRRELGDNLILRSNFVGEDGTNKSYAGIFKSFIRIDPADIFNYIDKIVDYKDVSKEYIDNGTLIPGVIVQEFIEGNYSGVGFVETIGEKQNIIIEVVDGINEDLVSGKKVPTSFVIDDENINTILDTKGLNINMDNLVTILDKIKNIFSADVDVEFTIKDNGIYVLQVRPVTESVDMTNIKKIQVDGIDVIQEPKMTSKGSFEEDIFVIKHEDDIKKINKECSIITDNLYPSLTLKLSFIKGVISENGAYLAHLSIVAREKGIPVIINVPNLLSEVENKKHNRVKFYDNVLTFFS